MVIGRRGGELRDRGREDYWEVSALKLEIGRQWRLRRALTLLKLLSSVKLALSKQLTASWAAISAGFATASSISACSPTQKNE